MLRSEIFDGPVADYLLRSTYWPLPPLRGDDTRAPPASTTAAAVPASATAALERLTARLQAPPLFTTLRVNTLRPNAAAAVLTAVEHQYAERGLTPPRAYAHPKLNDVIVVENDGPREGLARNGKEIVVDAACGAAVLRGANVFAQGVLGAPVGLRAGDVVSVYADVSSACLKGLTRPFNGPKLFVGNGRAELSREELFCGVGASLRPRRGVAVDVTEPLYTAPRLSDLLPSLAFAQNLPSAVCAHVLDPQPGERVLDMCAAPGGKTTHIATLMCDEGTLIALDKSRAKLRTVDENLALWGLRCCSTFACDATACCDRSATAICGKATASGGAALPREPPYPPASFDRILLDAPCSALGQRPCLRCDRGLPEVSSFPTLQRKLLVAAAELLRPGGTLVYSTCTLPLAENEGAVAWALSACPELELAPQTPRLGACGLPCEGLSDEQRCMLQRFDPSFVGGGDCGEDGEGVGAATACDGDTIGFFIAKFAKKLC